MAKTSSNIVISLFFCSFAGHGDNGWKYVPRIIQSLAGQVVVQVTCGSYHTAAVTGNGDLYTWVSFSISFCSDSRLDLSGRELM